MWRDDLCGSRALECPRHGGSNAVAVPHLVFERRARCSTRLAGVVSAPACLCHSLLAVVHRTSGLSRGDSSCRGRPICSSPARRAALSAQQFVRHRLAF